MNPDPEPEITIKDSGVEVNGKIDINLPQV